MSFSLHSATKCDRTSTPKHDSENSASTEPKTRRKRALSEGSARSGDSSMIVQPIKKVNINLSDEMRQESEVSQRNVCLFESFDNDTNNWPSKLEIPLMSPMKEIDCNLKYIIMEELRSKEIDCMISSIVEERVNSKLSAFEDKINDLELKLDHCKCKQNEKQINFLNDKMAQLKSQNEALEKGLSYVQGIVDCHIMTIQKLQDFENEVKIKLDHHEQYSRRHSLRIINNVVEKQGEDTDQIVIDIAKKMLDKNIEPYEIDRSHRIGKPNRNNERPIIVKFVSYNTKRQIFRARKRLNFAGQDAKGVYINEDLTKTRQQMLSLARGLQKDHLISDCWTLDGNIWIRDFYSKARMWT